MNNKEKSKIIIRILNNIYPKVPVPLNYKNTFTLLVSVLLSAQCTDVNVNNVTKKIYPRYNKPHHFVKLGRKRIENLICDVNAKFIRSKLTGNCLPNSPPLPECELWLSNVPWGARPLCLLLRRCRARALSSPERELPFLMLWGPCSFIRS